MPLNDEKIKNLTDKMIKLAFKFKNQIRGTKPFSKEEYEEFIIQRKILFEEHLDSDFKIYNQRIADLRRLNSIIENHLNGTAILPEDQYEKYRKERENMLNSEYPTELLRKMGY